MIRTILGRRGCGKTTLAIQFLRERTKPAVVVSFDEGMFSQFPPSRRFFNGNDFLDHVIRENGLKINRPVLLSIFTETEFNRLCRAVILHRRLLFIVDEVDMFDTATRQDRDFLRIIHYGRHNYGGEIDLITASRRPARISRDLRSQTDEWFLFRTTDSRDLDFIAEDLRPDLPEQVRVLPPFKYLRFDWQDSELGTVRPPISAKFPKSPGEHRP